ncbi:DUF4340 domain-containing protein [Rubritalea squalenifaciens]|nr:DUF4340 domain-containing protein [Rubritalea squalenifaciens]
MRLFFTIILMLSTAALAVLTLVQTDQADFITLFNKEKVREPGDNLYDDNLLTTAKITILTGKEQRFVFEYDHSKGLWNCTEPWQDRADGPLHIAPLILMAQTAEIQEVIDIDEVDRKTFGITKDSPRIILHNTQGDELANFAIGRTSPWKKLIEGEEEILVPTVFIRKRHKPEKEAIYLCTDSTGDIHKLLENNLERFRDHRPFALNVHDLKQVRLKRGSSEIILQHEADKAAWKITKPLELETDRKATQGFLATLSKLTAVKLHPRASVTLPDNLTNITEIGVTTFSQDEEITLQIYPAQPGAASTYATVSDRDIVFELPLISTPSIPAYLGQIPADVNQLRSRNMVKLDRKDLRGVIVRTPQTTPVIISRIPGEPYKMLDLNNAPQPIDEVVLAELFQAVSLDPVKNFVSDAATDLSAYGLDNPFLTVDLLYFEAQPTRLQLGTPASVDTIYANLKGSPIVWELDTSTLNKISRFYWDWKPKVIWNLPVIDIIGFTTQQRDKPLVSVEYDYLGDTFTAKRGEEDISHTINPNRAKYFLNQNHLLTASKRLGPNHKQAAEALKNPIFTVTITVQNYDNQAMPSDTSTYQLDIARISENGSNLFYYGKASNDPDYLRLDLDTVKKLATDIFDED